MAEAAIGTRWRRRKMPRVTKEILEAAKEDLWQTYKLHPDLGGEKRFARYDRLLKQIQKGLGAKESGWRNSSSAPRRPMPPRTSDPSTIREREHP